MKDLQAILERVIVKQYYRRNIGFFFLVFFLAFGIQNPSTLLISPHFLVKAIHSAAFIGGTLLCCFLFYLKCWNFIYKTLLAPENEFLFAASLLSKLSLLYNLGNIHILLFIPALGYTILLMGYAFWLNASGTFVILLTFNLFLLTNTVVSFYLILRKTPPETILRILNLDLLFKLKHISLWPLRHLIQKEKVLLLLTKLFSLAILFAFIQVYPDPSFDLRAIRVGFLFAVVAHIPIILRLQQFQETQLNLLRQLPYPTYNRLLQQLIQYLLLLLPEVLFLFRSNMSIYYLLPLLTLVVFGISLLLVFLVLMYQPNYSLNQFIKQSFFLFLGLLLLLLASTPIGILAFVHLWVSYLLFKRWFYQYETLPI
ncbi:hypothetical protein [Adhaeribacter aquaticus]|uniref:hypothetical protein n=1 Tax=Adhaeribacter aquaticus TaxID=299567 RepID=UPI0003F7D9B8|nr:hypothetical protein [Adhaeribacter aquaticus]